MSEIPAYPDEWTDERDEWTAEIKASYPTRSGSHDEYATAMRMVGHRHSKGELVALVNWLLVQLRETRTLLTRAGVPDPVSQSRADTTRKDASR